jgi:stage II sporulation protein R
MKKIIIILSIITLFLLFNKTTDELIIPKDSIRIRVIANSNNTKDQLVKQLVKNKVESDVTNLLINATNIDDVRSILKDNIDIINTKVDEVLKKNDYTTSFNVDFGYNFFPEKQYKGVTYNEGYYESLVITLGNGEGNNWWCVLFPPLCLMETDENNLEEIEYKSFIKEIIDKYF